MTCYISNTWERVRKNLWLQEIYPHPFYESINLLNTLKQFVGCCRQTVWVFDHFGTLCIKALKLKVVTLNGALTRYYSYLGFYLVQVLLDSLVVLYVVMIYQESIKTSFEPNFHDHFCSKREDNFSNTVHFYCSGMSLC